MPIDDDRYPNERVAFVYRATDGDGSYVRLADDDRRDRTFEFAVTNARVYVESDLTGRLTLPLEEITIVSSGVVTDVPQRAEKIGSLLTWGFAVVAALAIGSTLVTASSVVGAILAVAVTGYLGARAWSWVRRGYYRRDYRLLGFTREGSHGGGEAFARDHAGLNMARGDPEHDAWDVLVRFPDDAFTPDHTRNLGEFSVPTGTDEAELFALPKVLFGAAGLRLLRPDEHRDDERRTEREETPYSGGPNGLSGYVCESCGEDLNIFTEVREGTSYTCRNCGHELDQQGEVAEQLWFAEGADTLTAMSKL